MFYRLASILFPTRNQYTFNPLNVSVRNASDTEFCLSPALANEMDMASLTFLISN